MFGSSMTTLPPEDLLGSGKPSDSPPTGKETTMTKEDDSTTKKSVSGQFEDADDATTNQSRSNTTALAWLAAAAEQDSLNSKPSKPSATAALPSMPEPSGLQRRISTGTSNATFALLEMAATKPSSNAAPATAMSSKKKKKTFVVRLEELREYTERHGTIMNLENPLITEAQDESLYLWLVECRKQYLAGQLSEEKAKALALGCEGFDKKKQDDEDGDDASASRTEARYQKEHARRLEEHRIRELMMLEQQRLQMEHGNLLTEEQINRMTQQEGNGWRALWLQQQQEKEALRAQQMQQAAAAAGRRTTQDPDGTTLSDADRYPAESFQARMTHSLQEQRLLEEMYAREALNREALMMREQRLAAAMAASRLAGGAPGYHPNAALFQQGRVMSLLQPLETVSARDPFLMGGMGYHHPDPRVNNALLRAQLMQQQDQQEQQRRLSDSALGRRLSDSALGTRRLSDASGSALGAPPPVAANADVAMMAAVAAPEETHEKTKKKKKLSKSAPTSPVMKKKKRKKKVADADAAPIPNSSTSGGGGKPRKSWDERMKEMWNFFLTYGHTQVQTRGQHKELGRWLSAVRCRMRDGLLPQHHVKEFLAMQEWSLGEGVGLEETAFVDTVASGTTAPESNHSSRRNSGSTAMSHDHAVDLNEPKDDLNEPKGGCSINNSITKGKRALPKSWNQSFVELQAFKARFGHSEVKMIGSSPWQVLGKWLASQRSRHKLGQLPEDKVKRLRDLGCSGFGPNPTKESEEEAQQEEEKRGHASLYRKDDEEAEFDAAIRRLKAAKELCQLEESEPMTECAVSAEATPTNSAPNSPMAKDKRVRHSYETRVVHIKQFKEKYGHCKIKLGSNDKHEELLARWLASARSRYRGGQFKEDRAAELRALGCDGFEPLGSLPGDAKVEESDSKVVAKPVSPAAKKRDAPARTATPSPTPSPSLEAEEEDGTGEPGEPPCKKQRSNAKRQTFDDMLKELESYQYVYGVGCSVPKPDGDKGKLGRWLAFQRRQFIAGKLTADRVEKLKTIGRKEFLESALLLRAAEMSAANTNDQ